MPTPIRLALRAAGRANRPHLFAEPVLSPESGLAGSRRWPGAAGWRGHSGRSPGQRQRLDGPLTRGPDGSPIVVIVPALGEGVLSYNTSSGSLRAGAIVDAPAAIHRRVACADGSECPVDGTGCWRHLPGRDAGWSTAHRAARPGMTQFSRSPSCSSKCHSGLPRIRGLHARSWR